MMIGPAPTKRLLCMMPLFLALLLLLGGPNDRVEGGTIAPCGSISSSGGAGSCSCDTDSTAGTKVLLNCEGVTAGFSGQL